MIEKTTWGNYSFEMQVESSNVTNLVDSNGLLNATTRFFIGCDYTKRNNETRLSDLVTNETSNME